MTKREIEYYFGVSDHSESENNIISLGLLIYLIIYLHVTIILRNRAEYIIYRLILSQADEVVGWVAHNLSGGVRHAS